MGDELGKKGLTLRKELWYKIYTKVYGVGRKGVGGIETRLENRS